MAKFKGDECDSIGLENFKICKNILLIWYLGLSFPRISNIDENFDLVNFLSLSIFDKATWTDDYAKQHNISVYGKKYLDCLNSIDNTVLSLLYKLYSSVILA